MDFCKWVLTFGICLVFGAWNLGFGVERLQEILQRYRILNRKCLSIIIKINVADFNVLTQPGNSLCPLGKLLVSVTTGIQALATMETDIGEITGSDKGAAETRHIENAQSSIVPS